MSFANLNRDFLKHIEEYCARFEAQHAGSNVYDRDIVLQIFRLRSAAEPWWDDGVDGPTPIHMSRVWTVLAETIDVVHRRAPSIAQHLTRICALHSRNCIEERKKPSQVRPREVSDTIHADPDSDEEEVEFTPTKRQHIPIVVIGDDDKKEDETDQLLTDSREQEIEELDGEGDDDGDDESEDDITDQPIETPSKTVRTVVVFDCKRTKQHVFPNTPVKILRHKIIIWKLK